MKSTAGEQAMLDGCGARAAAKAMDLRYGEALGAERPVDAGDRVRVDADNGIVEVTRKN